MANLLKSKITPRQVLLYTHQTNKKNRFNYMNRDVLKSVLIQKVKEFDTEGKQKAVKYKICAYTYSYPNYYPYNAHTSSNKQRKYKHQYYIIMEFETLSIDSLFKWRVGFDKKWVFDPPYTLIRTVSHKERNKIKSDIENTYKNKTKEFKNVEYKKRIKKHKDNAKFLNVGDYNSKVHGINGDFYFRLSKICYDMKILYGRHYSEIIPDDVEFPFFDKHTIRLLTTLIKKNIIKI